MKKYKPNYLLSFTIQMTLIMLSVLPSGIIMMILSKNAKEVVIFIVGFFLIIIIFVFLMNLLNLIIKLFVKWQIEIYDHFFKRLHFEARYDEVYHIVYDLGQLSRNTSTPCNITFFDKDYKMLISIDNPEFIMSVKLIKKCYRADFKIRGYKFYLWMSLIMAVLFTLLIIFGK